MSDDAEDTIGLAELLQNDRDYFAAGAQSLRIDGANLRWMEGLQHLAAGCIIEPDHAHGIPQPRPDALPNAWAKAATAIGAVWLRLYSSDDVWQRRVKLGDMGFAPTTELAMARSAEARQGDPSLPPRHGIRPVTTGEDWTLKQRLADTTIDRPDGKEANAQEWTALERTKAEAGYARFWILELDGRPCATFGLSPAGSLLRIKNIAVHPDYRRSGIGRMLVAFALDQARRHGIGSIGAFAFPDGQGRMLYASCGFEVVGAQTEWSRPLPHCQNLDARSVSMSC